ncbi:MULTISPECIES: hypothetical protein [Hymenobacter]|uniref:Uncharacterized protein n=1 Tax=Hymenobacter mucosus TaxID=1411120 RepID=A0A239BC56_9BACT|nr:MULTISPECIES: hypothetical protein [Hymenobacter]MDF7815490.1 hypothetical protein [Hymenobacter sp. YC55]SNS05269.1 hypothetical protein SAMN06269173_12110 [Hymenobacter mucosus]
MSDFADFRTQARAAFPDLNVSVMMYDKETATGSGLIYYRLKAAGMKIGAASLTAEATSPAEAIASMIRQVAQARRATRAAADAAMLARSQRPAYA